MTMKSRILASVVMLMLVSNSFAASNLSTVTASQQSKLYEQTHLTLAFHGRTASYRSSYYRRPARRNSKLRTALTIAAPAAVGAGIGALAGGKKGAGVGALLGGGGGAIYHLYKSRPRY